MKYGMFFLFLLIASLSFGADSKPEVYTATAIDTNSPTRIPVKIYIYSQTSDEEVVELANLLKTKGADAVLKKIGKAERGRLAPIGRTGTDVGFVRKRPVEKGTLIMMVMERPVAFRELFRSARSTDYPFGILQMQIHEDGKAEGSLIVAAKVQFTKENTVEVESYGIAPMRLMGLKKLD